MSTNAFSEDKGNAAAGGSGATQAPKLRGATHYAVWRRDMEVWLERHGAAGVHARVIDAKQWKHFSDLVAQWSGDELAEAMSFFSLGGSGGASATKAAEPPTDEQKQSQEIRDADAKRRKALTAMVQASTRIYGVLYGSTLR